MQHFADVCRDIEWQPTDLDVNMLEMFALVSMSVLLYIDS